jgi:transmembrane sensor
MNDPDKDLSRIRSQLRRWDTGDIEAGLREFQHRRAAGGRLDRCISQIQSRLHRWGPGEVEAGLLEFQFRRKETSRRRRSVAFGSVAVAAAALLIVGWSASRHHGGPSSAVADRSTPNDASRAAPTAPTHEVLALDDGSEVTLLDHGSHADVTETKADQISVALTKGRAQFRIKHTPGRTFVVQVGGVRIEDLGTTFVIERGLSEVMVTVSEGALRVSWDDRSAELTAGTSGTYPIGSQPSERDKPASQAASGARGSSGEAWRTAAREGRYGPAFNLLQQDGFETVRDEPNDLLLAADVARLSGHPRDAVKPLRTLLHRYRRDPRSPAAAFTLGSVLMRDLGRPREAAQAFADAERLAPAGNLAEDAIARAAEAWHRAGDDTRARAELARYASAYPQGRHLSSLRGMIDSR